ncbi:MAG: NUDIX hydrolase, partial [Planctomycetota bacterium]|nr:NUDIX hydrolase [Planctomycetota bacterium]
MGVAGQDLLRAGDPALAARDDLAHARTILQRYEPWNDDQVRVRADMLAFLDAHPDALHRTCLAGHLTGAALVLHADGERALLTHHAKLGSWLQLGGHCDGDANLPAVALREAVEESGIPDLAIDPTPIDLDVHPIPARPGEPEHLHLDARFLVHAPEDAREVLSHESVQLAWFG